MVLSDGLQKTLKRAFVSSPKGSVGVATTTVEDIVNAAVRPNLQGAIPPPSTSVDSIVASTLALKEAVETLNRQRGATELSAVRVHDLVDILELLVPFIIEEVRKEFHP
jgi:hypothetical protein